MPIKKHNQTRTYVDLPPKLFEQIEEVSSKFHIPRTTLLRRLVIYSFLGHLEAVLRNGEPRTWEEPELLKVNKK
jgi:hypothetical protein